MFVRMLTFITLTFITLYFVRLVHSYMYPINLYRWRRQTDVSYGSPAYKYCECGRRNIVTSDKLRIVGGHEVELNEYPWMALIMGNFSKLICGGSIINDRYIITAAHCLLLGFRKDEMKVVLGKHDVCKTESRTVIFSIEELILHPSYEVTRKFPDVMLVKVNMKMTFNKNIRPICLPAIETNKNIRRQYDGNIVSVLGWGIADISGYVCTLRIADLIIYKSTECSVTAPSLLCAGYKQSERGACQGDSGGPLQMIDRTGKIRLIGIVSGGLGCHDPGVYTNVAYVLPWILRVTRRDSMYCWR